MSVDELLVTLTSCGVSVAVDGDVLCLKPASRVPPELVAELRAAKRALLDRLRGPQGGGGDAIAHRVSAFRERGAPWVLIPDLPYERERCFSCGARLDDVLYGRCRACSEALWRALMNEPVAEWPGRPQ